MVHEREARVGLDELALHALTVIECHCHALSQSHGAKGPEIEPRQRLLLWAAGIMCLVAAKRAAYGSGALLHW